MLPYEACSIGKAIQLVINEHVDNGKKATSAMKTIFADLATIEALQESNSVH